jgi:hypothetical protein
MLVMITKGPGRGDVFDVGDDTTRDDEFAALARRAIADGNACRVDRPTERRILIQSYAPPGCRPHSSAPPATSLPINGLVGIHAPPAPIFRRASTTHNAAIAQPSRASQSTALVTQSRADTAIASHAPPPQPRMSPGLWRWMPVVIVAVLTLMVAAQGASYLRMQESIDALRGELANRENAARAELVDQIGRQVRDGSESQRASLVQGVGDLLASQQESQRAELRQLISGKQDAEFARLNEQIHAAIGDQQAAFNSALRKLRTEQAAERRQELAEHSRQTAAVPSPATWTNILHRFADAFVSSSTPTAAATTGSPEAIFFVDASGDLAFATSQVRDEIARELVKLDARRPARLMIFRPDHPVIDVPATMLDQVLAAQTSAPDASDADAAHPASLTDALQVAAAAHPHQLFILSDRLGDGSDFDKRSLRQSLGDQNHNGEMRIHALQFFAADARETMRAIARENGGTYSFVPRG